MSAEFSIALDFFAIALVGAYIIRLISALHNSALPNSGLPNSGLPYSGLPSSSLPRSNLQSLATKYD